MVESIKLADVRRAAVAHVTLARPDVRNAFNAALIARAARGLHGLTGGRRRPGDRARRRRHASSAAAPISTGCATRSSSSFEAKRRATRADERHVPRDRQLSETRRRPHPRRGARRRRGTRRRLRHRRRGRRRNLRFYGDQARHHAGGDLAVRDRENRRVARARALPHRRTLRRRARDATSASCTRSCRRRELDAAVDRVLAELRTRRPDPRSRARSGSCAACSTTPYEETRAITAHAIAQPARRARRPRRSARVPRAPPPRAFART